MAIYTNIIMIYYILSIARPDKTHTARIFTVIVSLAGVENSKYNYLTLFAGQYSFYQDIFLAFPYHTILLTLNKNRSNWYNTPMFSKIYDINRHNNCLIINRNIRYHVVYKDYYIIL